jgi:hypothetical protein
VIVNNKHLHKEFSVKTSPGDSIQKSYTHLRVLATKKLAEDWLAETVDPLSLDKPVICRQALKVGAGSPHSETEEGGA